MNHAAIQLFRTIKKRQENCIHPSEKIELLNGKIVCVKCAKVMGENNWVCFFWLNVCTESTTSYAWLRIQTKRRRKRIASNDIGNIDDYKNSDSINLKTVDGQIFTIVDWKKSDYEDKGKSTPGIKFTVKEKFEDRNILHTTRQVIVNKFYKIEDGQIVPTELGQAVKNGTAFAVKCEQMKAKQGGNDYFDLVAAKQEVKQESL